MSIRLRLVFWHSLVFAVGLTAFAVVVWLGTREVWRNDIDMWLTRQADGLERFLRTETLGQGEAAVVEETREFSTGLPKGSGVQLFTHDGRLLLSRPEVTIGGFPEHPETFINDQATLRALTRRVTIAGEEFRLALWRSLDESEQALADLRLVLIAMAPVFLLLSIAGGWFLSRRALQPVDEITAAARRISLQNFSGALPVPSHRDELQRLCQAWNEMLRRLEVSAQQLRQFTANASHELRTPVALIRATAELTLRQERSPAEYQDALHRVRQESEELTHVIENLMELARADAPQSRLSFAPIDVRELLSEVRPHIEPITAQNNLDLREVHAQIARVPAAKASTREELFRRLQVAREYLHSHVDRRVSLDEVAREACVSRYHLHRAFTRVFRETPHAYLTRLRLARAHSFLESGRAVTDVAADVGFLSLSAFTRLFRGHYGVPPSSVPKIRKIGQAHR